MASEIFSLIGRISVEGAETVDKAVNKANKSAETLSAKMGKVGENLSKTGEKMREFGGNLTTYVTAPLAGLATVSVATFAKFDDSMRAVSAAMGDKLGASVEEQTANFEKLREQAVLLGSTTSFSASEAAEGMKALAQSGWDTAQIMAGTGDMLNLAAAGAMELGETADIVTNVMSVFSMQVDETGRAADVLATAASNSPATIYDMGEAFKYAGAAAATAGMDVEETTAILATFGEAGIVGSQAGTMLGSMLTDIQAKAKNSAVQIGKTKVAVYDSSGAMRGMADIMADVEKATDGMTDAEKNSYLTKIFGVEAMRGVNIMLQQGSEKTAELEEKMRNSDGAAQDMADTMESGIGGALRNLEGSFERAMITIGDKFAPAVQGAAESLSNLITRFSEMDSRTQNIILIIAGIAAAIGPLIIGFGSMVGVLGFALQGFAKLGGVFAAIASPVGLIVIALAALAAAFIFAYTQSEGFRNVINKIFSTLGGLVMAGLTAAAGFIRSIWGSVSAWWKQDGAMILQALTNVFNFMLPIIQFVMAGIVNTITMYWGIAKTIFTGALNIIMGIVSAFGALFTGNWSQLWESVKQIFSGALQLVWGLIQLWFIGKVLAVVGAFVGRFLGWFRNLGSQASGIISGMVSRVTGFFTNLGSRIASTASNMVTRVIGFFSNMSTRAGAAMTQLRNGAANAFNSAKDAIMSPIKTATEFVAKQIDKIKGFFTDLKGKLKIPKFTLPQMPKFTLEWASKEFLGKTVKYPTGFDVEWYDKGGIFTSPSIIGVGEGGRPEFVGALDDLRKIVREESGSAGGLLTITIPVELDGREIARVTAPHIDTELARRQQRDARNRGRGVIS